MAKNKDININPSKGISIIIKNDIQQPATLIKPKKKRKYKRINVLPKTPAPPIMQQSAGDVSYIKDQPGRFSLWRDNPTATPVITLAQATTQGYIPQFNQQQQQQITAPQPQQQIAAPPQPSAITVNFGDFMRALQPQEYSSSKPESRFQEIDNGLDINDTFYQALPDDKKEAYNESKLNEMAKNIDDTAAKAVADAENTDFFKNQLDAPTQAETIEKTKYLAMQQKLDGMKPGIIKQWGTKDSNKLSTPRYPQNKIYRESYLNGLIKQKDEVKKRIDELDTIISTKSEKKVQRAEIEKADKIKEITKLEDLQQLMKDEKKRIKKILK
jgi:hypothetical protein